MLLTVVSTLAMAAKKVLSVSRSPAPWMSSRQVSSGCPRSCFCGGGKAGGAARQDAGGTVRQMCEGRIKF